MQNEWFGVVREVERDTARSMPVYRDQREAEVRAERENYEYPTLAPFVVVPLVVAP